MEIGAALTLVYIASQLAARTLNLLNFTPLNLKQVPTFIHPLGENGAKLPLPYITG